jgi:hypothetical protein
MPDANGSTPTHQQGGRSALNWFEVVATALLALATVATAWSGYQATRWGGEQAKASARVNAARIDAARAADLANTQTEVDIATFIQWVDAYARNEAELADFYWERFREEFRPAVEAWVATEPLENPGAPLSPFAMAEYHLAAHDEAERLDLAAEANSAEVRRDIQRQSNYVLGVVLFAAALFFAGMSTRVSSRPARLAVLGLGCIVFLGTVAWIATFPVSVSV